MANKTKSTRFGSNYRLFGIVLFTFILLLSFAASFIRWNMLQNDKYELDKTRSLISDAAGRVKDPVPIDARTGDYFVSQHRLMVRANDELRGLAYSYHVPDEYSGEMTSFSTRSMQADANSTFQNASTVEELFNSVPQKQACLRGISIHDREALSNPEIELFKSKQLSDGRVIYIYTEVACPQLKDFVEVVYNNIDSY